MRPITNNRYLQDYVDYLNRTLNDTVTDSRILLLSGPDERHRLVTAVDGGELCPLELRPRGLLPFRQLVWRETWNDGDHWR